jgi:NTE family protein
LQGEKLADVGLPDHLPKNVEEAKIPLKIIAADFERMEEVVITHGPVVTAVGASIAIPGLIEAPRINGRVHVDGGVVNPVPFDKVRDGMDVVVAIDVTGKPRPISGGKASNLELAVGSLLIMFHQLAESRKIHNPPDIYIEPAVDQFGSGDLFRVQEIFDAAEPAKVTLKRALERRL